MAKAMMANPELRHPYAETPINEGGGTTVLYQGQTFRLAETGQGDGLLVSAADLTRINGFEIKPEGACLGDLCIPLTANVLVERDGHQWCDLVAFAELLGQPYVAESNARVWSFAEIPAKRDNKLLSGLAPDFAVRDRQGRMVTLADLKGKKALIVTWSSW